MSHEEYEALRAEIGPQPYVKPDDVDLPPEPLPAGEVAAPGAVQPQQQGPGGDQHRCDAGDDDGPAAPHIAYARAYGRMGWFVFPVRQVLGLPGNPRCDCRDPSCKNVGKHPRIRWSKEATTDPEVIERFWGYGGGNPFDNIGVACGAISGIWVLDIDPKSGGFETIAKLETEHGPLPRTATAITGSRGEHRFFKYPGPEFRNTAGALGSGLDSRGDGGYVVAAPSLHKSGRRYRWKYGPAETPLAEVPDWLLALLPKSKPKQAHRQGTPAVHHEPQGAHFGHRLPPTRKEAAELLATILELPVVRWMLEEPNEVSRAAWMAVAANLACAVQDHSDLLEAARRTFHGLSAPYDGYTEAETETIWENVVSFGKPTGWAAMDGLPERLVIIGTSNLLDAARRLLRVRQSPVIAMETLKPEESIVTADPSALIHVVQPGETAKPLFAVQLPDTIPGQRLECLRRNAAIKWSSGAPPAVRGLVASVLKAAAEGEPEIAAAREIFLEQFPGEEAVFDSAVPRDVSYFEFTAQGFSEDVTGRSPLQEAYQQTFAAGLGSTLSPTHATCCRILRLDRQLRGGALEYNLMRDRITLDRRDVTDNDIDIIRERIEQRVQTFVKGQGHKGLAFPLETAAHALAQVAMEHRFHPVQEYLSKLQWDGEQRLDRVVSHLLNADATDINKAMVRKFLISCVARALKPGCKVDTMLVLYGAQGFQKSAFLKRLAGEDWFSDAPMDLDDRDNLMAMRRAWIYEWPELASMFNARTEEDIKAGLTRTIDTYRPPYARTDIDAPRHTVFAGTTNKPDIFSDVTGNRRFWPITVTKRIDLDKVGAGRDQVWAEAVVAFKAGEEWWLSEREERVLGYVQKDFEQLDEWTDNVLQHLHEHPEPQLLANIAGGALGVKIDKLGKTEQNRLTKILRKAGWAPRRITVEGVERRCWVKLPTLPTEGVVSETAPLTS